MIKEKRKTITLHLRVELINMLDELAAETHAQRPNVLEVLVGREYKALMRKRAQASPTVPLIETPEVAE